MLVNLPESVDAAEVGSYNLDVRPMADCDKIRPRLLKPPEIVHFTGWFDVGDEDFEMWSEDDVFFVLVDVDVF